MKKLFIVIPAAIIILAVVAFLGKNLIAKAAIENGVKLITGLQLSVEEIDVNLFKTYVQIEELRLLNPPGYDDKVMVNIPEILFDYELGSFFRGKAHIEQIRIDLKELTVIRNKDGSMNIDQLKSIKEQQEKKAGQTPSGTPAQTIPLQIDVLSLRVGRVIFKDYTKGEEPYIKGFDINIDETYYNITDPNYLVSLIMFKALQKTTIANLTNFSLNDLKSSLPYTLLSGKDIAGAAGAKAQETLGNTPDMAQDVAGGVGTAAKKTGGVLKGLFSTVKDSVSSSSTSSSSSQ